MLHLVKLYALFPRTRRGRQPAACPMGDPVCRERNRENPVVAGGLGPARVRALPILLFYGKSGGRGRTGGRLPPLQGTGPSVRACLISRRVWIGEWIFCPARQKSAGILTDGKDF